METWALLLVYVLAFGVLQLALYKYFSSEDPSPESTPRTVDVQGPRSGGSARQADDGHEGVYCPHCGAFNERMSTILFCRECVHSLR